MSDPALDPSVAPACECGEGWNRVLDQSLGEIQERLERQRALLRACAPRAAAAAAAPACPLISCRRLDRMRGALVETVATLEETRRSFKSRQLEALRKKLIEVLAEP